MNIVLYKNNSDKRALNKTLVDELNIENVRLLEGDNSLLSPQLILSGVNVANYNYCFIPDFNRYYFISSVDVLDNRRFMIRCNVDVLMSFSNDIKNLTVISGKAATNFNKFLSDSLPISAKRNIIVKNLTGGEINSEFITDVTNNIVINYLSGGANSGN